MASDKPQPTVDEVLDMFQITKTTALVLKIPKAIRRLQREERLEAERKAKECGEQHGIPRGKPKSGRISKGERKKFSSIIKSRGFHTSLAKKQKLREDLKRVKEKSRAIKAQKEAEKEAKKQRRRENLKRAEENRKKSEIVQVIKNPAKIKRMKKKQLRMIEKRDTN